MCSLQTKINTQHCHLWDASGKGDSKITMAKCRSQDDLYMEGPSTL